MTVVLYSDTGGVGHGSVLLYPEALTVTLYALGFYGQGAWSSKICVLYQPLWLVTFHSHLKVVFALQDKHHFPLGFVGIKWEAIGYKLVMAF